MFYKKKIRQVSKFAWRILFFEIYFPIFTGLPVRMDSSAA